MTNRIIKKSDFRKEEQFQIHFARYHELKQGYKNLYKEAVSPRSTDYIAILSDIYNIMFYPEDCYWILDE